MTLAVIDNQAIEILRGQALDIEILVLNTDGTAANLAGATVLFGISKAPKVDYDTTLTTSVTGSTITAELTSTIAAALVNQQYYFSCWVQISSEWTPVARGYLTVYNDSRTA